MSRRKRARRDQAPPAPTDEFPSHIPGRPWWGLYCGDGTEGYSFCGPEASMLVIGPPRSGKTSCVVVPNVLDAPAAVVSTSTKPDVLDATLLRRWSLGNCFVFDPAASTPLPSGAYPLRWSPVVGCSTFEAAVAMAHALGSAARPGSEFSESAHWVERAEGLLAPLLFAANLAGRDMASVCRWVIGRDLREPEAYLHDSGHEMAQIVLAGVLGTEEREQSGIVSTASGLLAAYRSESALATTRDPNFDPVAFAHSTDALYICAPADAQAQLAPLVVALLEQIRSAVYARLANAAPVVFALDEVASIAPLPSLPALAAEGGGQRLITLACLQDLSQARSRWGDVAEGFFSLFNTKLVFPGVGDHRTLQLISALAGESEIPTRSVNMPRRNLATYLSGPHQRASVTHATTWRPRLAVDEVSRGRQGHALRLDGSQLDYTQMVPWWQHRHWGQLASRRDAVFSEVVRPRADGDGSGA